MAPLPTALLTHLETDVVILERLVQRSRDQHKSAIFYQSAKHVLRVGKKVVDGLESYKLEAAESSQDASKREKRLAKLVKIFATTLLNSARKNSQQIKILYFLPLTTLLQAIYGRLFTLTLSLGPVFGLEADQLCGVARPRESTPKVQPSLQPVEAVTEDFGQRIERGGLTSRDRDSEDHSTSVVIHSSRSASVEASKASKPTLVEPVMPNSVDRSAAKPSKRPSAEPAGPPRVEKKAKVKTTAMPLETTSLDAIFGAAEVKKKKKKKIADAGEGTSTTNKMKKKKADEMEAIFG